MVSPSWVSSWPLPCSVEHSGSQLRENSTWRQARATRIEEEGSGGQELVYHQVSVCDVQVPSVLEVGLSWVSFPLWRWTQGLDTPHKRSAVSQFAALSWLYVDPSGVSPSAYLPLVTSAVCTAKMTEVPAGCQDPTAGRGVMGEWHTRQGDGCCYDRNTGVVLAGTGEEILTEPSSYPW